MGTREWVAETRNVGVGTEGVGVGAVNGRKINK